MISREDVILFEDLNLKSEYLSVLKNRLDNESFYCFGIIDKEKSQLVYYSWINCSNNYLIKEVNKTYNFSSTKSCLFEDDNTKYNYRGLGLHSYVMIKRINFCLEYGIKKIYIIIDPNNLPAIKTIKKLGFKRINIIPFYFRYESIKSSFFLLKKK
jgi:hypothetical protein